MSVIIYVFEGQVKQKLLITNRMKPEEIFSPQNLRFIEHLIDKAKRKLGTANFLLCDGLAFTLPGCIIWPFINF